MTLYAVADCNNFFVSCERLSRPELRDVPVVVLSNNDGCVIARSNEAKALGIKMGQPFFQVRPLYESGRLKVRSSNHELYAEVSQRVMAFLREEMGRIEQYSIDECFMDFTGIPAVADYGRDLSQRLLAATGIPVSIGIAPTKTLAKIANHFAKKHRGYRGCCLIDTPEKRQRALALTPIDEVWGIGRRYSKRLLAMGVRTAADFASWSEAQVQAVMALPGTRTWRELNGQACLSLETPVARKSLTVSRTFRKSIGDRDTLRTRVADFAALCAEKLRREGSAAGIVTTYVCTNRFRPDQPQYANAAKETLEVATSDLRELIGAALRALDRIYKEGYAYKRAGVVLGELHNDAVQGHLFDSVDRRKQERLLTAIDRLRRKMGRGVLRTAVQSAPGSYDDREFLETEAE